jgi:hypothetical protein
MHVGIVLLLSVAPKLVLLMEQPPKQMLLKEQPLLMAPYKGLHLLPLLKKSLPKSEEGRLGLELN